MSGTRSTYDSAPPSAAVIPSRQQRGGIVRQLERQIVNSSKHDIACQDKFTRLERLNHSLERTLAHQSARPHTRRQLGAGAFGVVWKGKWHNNDVAVKQIKLDNTGGEAAHAKAMAEFANEIGRMASMQPHENLVLFYGVTTLENGDMAAVVEYCAHGSCLDALYGAKPRAWTDDELIRIAHGAASGIAHLHRLGIIHRDIAARNVLLTRLDVAKVADFGMSRVMDEGNAYL
jgi:serine/threonine protein kinase